MVHNFTRTVALDISGFPATTARNVIASAIANRFLSLKVTALQFVGNIARVSFADTASKELIMRMESVYVGDIACPVRGGGPRPQKVFIHNYPFEASSDSLSLVLKRFGDVKDISHRRWLHMKDIFDGVRVVTMIRDKPIPRNLDVDGFHVKVSYYGQSVECDICNNHGHVARDCPLKGKCLWCHQPGHLQRDCTNPRAGDNSDVGSAEGGSPSGPPAPVNVDTSSVSGSQASEGVPSGWPSEPVTADSQPIFSADESSEPSDKHINTGSCEMENIEMENTESNIVNDKECGNEEVLSKDESSSKSINSDTQIESFSSLSGERSWAEVVESSVSSVKDSSMPILSSWDSGTTNELMNMDAAGNPIIPAGVTVMGTVSNTRSPTVVGAQPTEKDGSTPGRSASPAVRSDISSSSAGRPGLRKRARPTPAVADTAIRRSRDRASHIPVAAIQAAKAALKGPR